MTRRIYFYHPDYTVGIGIAPIQPKGSQTITAGLGIAPYPENKSLRIKYPQEHKLFSFWYYYNTRKMFYQAYFNLNFTKDIIDFPASQLAKTFSPLLFLSEIPIP